MILENNCTKDSGIIPGRTVTYIKDTEEMSESRERQAETIEHVLKNIADEELCIFTDGSALGNSGPTEQALAFI